MFVLVRLQLCQCSDDPRVAVVVATQSVLLVWAATPAVRLTYIFSICWANFCDPSLYWSVLKFSLRLSQPENHQCVWDIRRYNIELQGWNIGLYWAKSKKWLITKSYSVEILVLTHSRRLSIFSGCHNASLVDAAIVSQKRALLCGFSCNSSHFA